MTKYWPHFHYPFITCCDDQHVPPFLLLQRTGGSLILRNTVMTPRLIRVYTVCNSLCIVWTHYSMVKPPCSNVRVITANVLVSEFLGALRCLLSCYYRGWLHWFWGIFQRDESETDQPRLWKGENDNGFQRYETFSVLVGTCTSVCICSLSKRFNISYDIR